RASLGAGSSVLRLLVEFREMRLAAVLAAIDLDAFAGNIAGLVRGEEGGQRSDVLGSTEALSQHIFAGEGENLWCGRLHRRGDDDPRGDGIAAHPLTAILSGYMTGHIDHRRLAGAIVMTQLNLHTQAANCW